MYALPVALLHTSSKWSINKNKIETTTKIIVINWKKGTKERDKQEPADISVNDLNEFNKVHFCVLLLLCLMQLLMFSLRSVSFAMLVYVIICTMMSLIDRSFICQHKHLLIKFMCLFCTLSFMILDWLIFVYCT